MRQIAATTILLLAALFAPVAVAAETGIPADEVTIGFQRVYSPWKVAIADGRFEAATGARINWRKFDSGARVMDALAAGEVDIAMAGSSPISGGVSRGAGIELFWIAADIGSAEALVARKESGITAPQDLRGRRLGVPFGSTAHFHLLFALEQFRIAPDEVDLVDMQPPSIASAWDRGEIDAAFVWNPALAHVKKTGSVLITSGLLSGWGRATFDGLVAQKAFADAHPDFLCRFTRVVAEADAAYRADPDSFNPGTDNARKIATLTGGDDTDVRAVLDLYDFPPLAVQASRRWLGGDGAGGAARALQFTADFLFEQGRIEQVLPDPAMAVTDRHVQAVLAGCD